MKREGVLKNKINVDQVRSDVKEKILSMSDIARQMGISKTNLSRFLNGHHDADAMIFRSIDWLGKTTDDYAIDSRKINLEFKGEEYEWE